MTIILLCAGALAIPLDADGESDRRVRLARHGPSPDGAFARRFRRSKLMANDGSTVPPAASPHVIGASLERREAATKEAGEGGARFELPDETWLRRVFALPHDDTVAAYATHHSQAGSVSLQIRPVHLQVGLDRLVLQMPAADEVTSSDATALAQVADTHFAQDGLLWRATTPLAWTLSARNPDGLMRLQQWAKLRCASARAVAGRRIDAFLPAGAGASGWQALSSELQMLWHEHPVNEAREASGLLALNSVWLEGCSTMPQRTPFQCVVTSDDAVTGLALATGAEVSAAGPGASAQDVFRLFSIRETPGNVLIDPGWWRTALSSGDAQAWQRGWRELDALIEMLVASRASPTTIVLGGERDLVEFEPGRAQRWAFWRNQSLAAVFEAAR